jgi:catechol 2,3-dioxygenase-like lactoylglutathione lyase family enzyme
MSAFDAIRAVDYTVIITRDMAAMRNFYEGVMGFTLGRALSENWFEYRIGDTVLALSAPGLTAEDVPVPTGTAALQLAFRVPVAGVDGCAAELVQKGIALVSPPTDRDFGHRTLFFRDPDGNLIEIYAEI